MTQPYFLLPHVEASPHGPLAVKKQSNPDTVFIDNFFGHFDDFSLKHFYSADKVDILPKDAIKFLLTFIHMPEEPHITLTHKQLMLIENDPKVYFVLWSALEHVIDHENLKLALKKKAIPLNKTIVMCSNVELHGKTIDGISYVDTEFWESYTRHHQKLMPTASEMTIKERLDTVDVASKKYICLNRNLKPHRIWFYYSFLKNANQDDAHISYHLPRVDKPAHERLVNGNYTLKYIPSELHRDFAYHARRVMLPKRLDTLDNQDIINYKQTIKPFYQDSLLSVVTESDFRQVFITEKTFKAIVHCHPFFIIGNREHHQYLRDRGYYTFENEFGIKQVENWDDSVVLFKHLNNLDIEVLKKRIKTDLKEKLEHNFNLFYNRTVSWNKVVNDLLNATRQT